MSQHENLLAPYEEDDRQPDINLLMDTDESDTFGSEVDVPDEKSGYTQAVDAWRGETALLRDKGLDMYDRLVQRSGMRVGLATGLTLAAGATAAEAYPMLQHMTGTFDSKLALTSTLGFMTAVAMSGPNGGALHDNYVARQSLEHAHLPRINSYDVENLVTRSKYDDDKNHQIVALVVPAGDRRQRSLRNDYDTLHSLAEAGGSDMLLVPAVMLPQSEQPDEGYRSGTLQEILADIKPYSVTVPNVEATERYCLVPVTPEDVAPYERTPQRLQGLLQALAGRFPDTLPEANVPQTEQQIHSVTDGVRRIAERGMEAVIETERYVTRDAEGIPEHRRSRFFTMPANGDDPFQPAIWIHQLDNVAGTPPERRELGSFVEDPSGQIAAQVTDILQGAALTTNTVLPVAAELLAELRKHQDHLRNPEDGIELPAVKITESIDRLLEIPSLERHNKLWRDKFKRAIGYSVLGAVGLGLGAGVVAGVGTLVGHSQHPLQTNNYTVSIGQAAETPMNPAWRIEAKGLPAEGYYADKKLYHYAGLSWNGEIGANGEVEHLPEAVQPGTAHIEVEAYTTGDALRAGIALPVKAGTRIAASRVTDADGAPITHFVLRQADGTSLMETTTNKGEEVHITYDLTTADTPDRATQDMVIENVQNESVDPEDTAQQLRQSAEYFQRYASYDNTEALSRLFIGQPAPRELVDRVYEAGIANCNVAATTLAIRHDIDDSNDNVAFTEGYRLDQGHGFLRTPHAWLTTADGAVIDGTPSLKGRSAAEAGDPPDDEADLQTAWKQQAQAFESTRSPDIPYGKIAETLLAGLAVSVAAGRAKYGLDRIRFALANRRLPAGQAEMVIAHRAYGGADAPLLRADETGLSMHSLPESTLYKVIADPRRAAPYLNRSQRRGLVQHARRLLAAYE